MRIYYGNSRLLMRVIIFRNNNNIVESYRSLTTACFFIFLYCRRTLNTIPIGKRKHLYTNELLHCYQVTAIIFALFLMVKNYHAITVYIIALSLRAFWIIGFHVVLQHSVADAIIHPSPMVLYTWNPATYIYRNPPPRSATPPPPRRRIRPFFLFPS